MAYYRNRNYTKRDYDCTNVVACVTNGEPPVENREAWESTDASCLKGLTQLYGENGVLYFGHM